MSFANCVWVLNQLKNYASVLIFALFWIALASAVYFPTNKDRCTVCLWVFLIQHFEDYIYQHCTPTSPNYHSCRLLCFSNVLARLLIVNLEDSALQFSRTCISSCVVERKAYLDSCEKGCVWFWTILSCAMSCQNHKFTFEHPPLLHPPFLSLSLLSLSSVYFAWTILTAPGTIRTQ